MLFREVEVVEMIDIFKAVHRIQNQIPKFVFTIFLIIQNVLIKNRILVFRQTKLVLIG